MKRQKLHEIEGKMVAHWLPEHRTMHDEWTNMNITLAEFQACVMHKCLNFSKAHQGRAWIIDSGEARGVFSDDIQKYVVSTALPGFMAAGVKYWINIRARSALTALTVQNMARNVGPAGIQLVTVDSLDQALRFLADVDAGRVKEAPAAAAPAPAPPLAAAR